MNLGFPPKPRNFRFIIYGDLGGVQKVSYTNNIKCRRAPLYGIQAGRQVGDGISVEGKDLKTGQVPLQDECYNRVLVHFLLTQQTSNDGPIPASEYNTMSTVKVQPRQPRRCLSRLVPQSLIPGQGAKTVKRN